MKKNGVIYRQARKSDIPKIVELEKAVWGAEMAADIDFWEKRINIFPKGVSVACQGKRIIGNAVTHIINYDFQNGFLTWEEATENGTLKNHDENGNVLYGVNISVLLIQVLPKQWC